MTWLKYLVLLILLAFSVSTVKAATLTVTKTADTNDGTCDSDCSLREALDVASSNGQADTIEFNLAESDPGFIEADGSRSSTAEPAGTYALTPNGYFLIELSSILSIIDADGIKLDGYSQTLSAPNTNPFGQPFNAQIRIQINGRVRLTDVENMEITGLALYHTSHGLEIFDATDLWLHGLVTGLDLAGNTSLGRGNVLYNSNWTQTDTIVGTNGDGVNDRAERNVISGNGNGLYGVLTHYDTTGGRVSGNYIGTSFDPNTCPENQVLHYQAAQFHSSNTLIGRDNLLASSQEQANVFGCTQSETLFRSFMRILGPGENPNTNTVVRGNYIGISPNGTLLRNLYGTGRGALNIQWGGVDQTLIEGNVIGGGDYGIKINEAGNTQDYRITYRNNVIKNNAILPVTHNIEEPTPIDVNDEDSGINDWMNPPEISAIEHIRDDKFRIKGRLLRNITEAPFTLEFCISEDTQPFYRGGCLESLGLYSVDLTSSPFWQLDIAIPNKTAKDQFVLTGLVTNGLGSTSEFGPDKTYHPPSPSQPELAVPGQSRVIKQGSSLVITEAQTFSYPVYFQHQTIHRNSAPPIRIGSWFNSTWQVSDIYQIWPRSEFNQAKVLNSEQPYIVALEYSGIDHRPFLPRHLKIAHSNDDGQSWQVLQSSVVDYHNQTVAAITKSGGRFMIVGRWF